MRRKDTEFVPLWIGEYNLSRLLTLTGVHMACAKSKRARYFNLLIIGDQIEMHAILQDLRIEHSP
jgi:hypothetical protein